MKVGLRDGGERTQEGRKERKERKKGGRRSDRRSRSQRSVGAAAASSVRGRAGAEARPSPPPRAFRGKVKSVQTEKEQKLGETVARARPLLTLGTFNLPPLSLLFLVHAEQIGGMHLQEDWKMRACLRGINHEIDRPPGEGRSGKITRAR